MSIENVNLNGGTTPLVLKAKDFATDQDVRWCPGCGDYSILKQVQTVLADLGKQPHETVFVSGIGCSSRFPYYMETYGLHSIHGRAPGFAEGLKIANPRLQVWMVTGDGDGLSIGGNHLLHLFRRNFDLNVLLFNNQIYGLTKGQYSPTSEENKRTVSTPFGSIDHPVNPVAFALGADATFVARSMDRDPRHLKDMLARADGHRGTSFLEIYQNCNIFNDGAYKGFTDKEARETRVLTLEHGKPLLFANKTKGIRFTREFMPEVIDIGADGKNLGEVFVWDETAENPAPAMALATASESDFPVPIGVFRRREKPSFESGVTAQLQQARAKKPGSVQDLLVQGELWTVE